MKKFKPWLVLALVFFTGIVVGVVGTRMVVRRIVAQVARNPDIVRTRIETELDRKLGLDANQRALVHAALAKASADIGDLKNEFNPRFRQILGETEQKIAAVLTPEQKKRLEQYREQNRRFFAPSGVRRQEKGR